ncbi:hypothetical protein [Nocardiopsis ansamitocini]|uniref:Uncharacterized protein n=1 Tax=Nocardiopsis ansamitocini TaxID=1670832 RepID=A0A9W6UI39_9ACTN|nr:hypothetical protein [Nocardiopsis ansamitocini]GLU47013.1 hypothetical protein Nans01_13640 [Nocardiopsis ansamitocini]
MNYPQGQPYPPHQGPQWSPGAPPPPPRKGRTGTVLLSIGLAIIVGLVVAIIVVLNNRGGGEPGPTPQPTPQPTEPAQERPEPSSPGESDNNDDDDAAAPEGDGEVPEAMAGTWSGTMTQYDPEGDEAGTWDLTVVLESGADDGTATLDIDGATCTWDLVVTTSGEDDLDMEYTTTDDGDGLCTASGFVHFIVDPNGLHTGVSTEWPTGISTSSGTLR